MAHKQLSVEEREEMQQGLWKKESVRSIAKRLGRSHSTIIREFNKNLPPQHRVYTPRLADERAQKKRKSRGRTDPPEERDGSPVCRRASQASLVSRADRWPHEAGGHRLDLA